MQITKGNILEAEGLVCIPVNMVGAAGAGLAKQWWDSETTPSRIMYRKACWSGAIRNSTIILGKWWLFPTKDHWKDKSSMEQMIARFVTDLYKSIDLSPFVKINIPRIGCGLGGLEWEEVKKQIVPIIQNFESTTGREVVIFE